VISAWAKSISAPSRAARECRARLVVDFQPVMYEDLDRAMALLDQSGQIRFQSFFGRNRR